ncbi:amidohydrolase family protein [Mycobacterium lentiflavum]|uniref:6-methylsalicylate decarboxylase n=1 Tax=Mycobacterium lentiflavum TaxID=141349 RepID=A0ABY3UWW1_MYCLN|nr:amidohydrolase family protein [Mycobacterium lentiflavum]ULP41607.1 amidohydrolase family protein [Mycobacterium lentiflavum]
MASSTVIDIHHHVLLNAHRAAGTPAPDWSIDSDRAAMDRVGIGGILLSLPVSGSAPQVRAINTALAEQAGHDPSRYGFLACVPAEDPHAAPAEIQYACAELHADGLCLPSNHAGIYVGDDRMDSILTELDDRGAVVLLHPGQPPAGVPLFDRPEWLCEFPFDTARAVIDLIYRGKIERFPRIRWIVSHAGGVLPFLAYRLSTVAAETGAITPSAIRVQAALRTLYYDLALSTSPAVFAALTELVDASHILFGSDYPMRSEPGVAESLKELTDYPGFDQIQKDAILSGSSRALFPRFARRVSLPAAEAVEHNRELYDRLYRGEAAFPGSAAPAGIPWDIGQAQPRLMELEAVGAIGGEVLDAGCGQGDNAIYLAQRGYSVTGLDSSPTAIEQARARAAAAGARVRFQVADATELAGYDAQFDTVIDSALYHCLDYAGRRAYPVALRRATRPGARLFLYCFSADNVNGVIAPEIVAEEEIRQALADARWRIDFLGPTSLLGNAAGFSGSFGDWPDEVLQRMPPAQGRQMRQMAERMAVILPLVDSGRVHLPCTVVHATRLD